MKVSLVTGGTKGIGLAISKCLLKDGYCVALTGRNATSVKKIVDELQERYPNQVLGFECDVRNMDKQKKCVNETLKKWNKIDVVVANAGIGHFASIDELTVEQWNETIDVNLTGVFHTVKASLDALKETSGFLITIASLAGTNFFANGSAYNASKFGLVGFTQAVMLDIRKYGIRTTTIMPGSVATNFNNHKISEMDNWKIQPEDIGKIVVDLIHTPHRTLPSKIEIRPSLPNK